MIALVAVEIVPVIVFVNTAGPVTLKLLVNVAIPVTFNESNSVCPVTSNPPFAFRFPPTVVIPETLRVELKLA